MKEKEGRFGTCRLLPNWAKRTKKAITCLGFASELCLVCGKRNRDRTRMNHNPT